MTAYLIVYGATPADRLAAYSFPTRQAAWAASTSPLVPGVGEHAHAGGCAYVIETASDAPFNGRALVEVFNGLTGLSVARFADRMSGVKRLMAALPEVAKPVEPQPEEKKTVSEHEKEIAPTKRRGRAPGNAPFAETDTISLLSENPKKPGSKTFERFAKLQDGMTVAEARALGFSTHDLVWDSDHKFISIA